MGTGGWMFLAVVVVVILWATLTYNALVRLRTRYRRAFPQVELQLRRRHDLVPNLLETAKGYMAHELPTLDAVIAARSGAVQAALRAAATPGVVDAMRDLARAEATLTGALARLFATADAYPRLKANENLIALQDELTSTENRVAFTRQGYNDAVMDYNLRRARFPTSLLASGFRFGPAEALQATENVVERTTAPIASS
jgi:LemA protein